MRLYTYRLYTDVEIAVSIVCAVLHTTYTPESEWPTAGAPAATNCYQINLLFEQRGGREVSEYNDSQLFMPTR